MMPQHWYFKVLDVWHELWWQNGVHKWCPPSCIQSSDYIVRIICYVCLCSLFVWPQCSRSCNGGYRVREVRCLADNIAPSELCDPSLIPESREECNKQPCVAEISKSNQYCCTKAEALHTVCPLQLGQSSHQGQGGPGWREISLWCCHCWMLPWWRCSSPTVPTRRNWGVVRKQGGCWLDDLRMKENTCQN